LVIAFHISQTDLSATGMQGLMTQDISRLGQIPVAEEVDHPELKGVKTGRRTKLAGMVEQIVDVLHSTGAMLKKGGYPNLGAFVIECAKRSIVDGKTGVSGGMFVRQVFPCDVCADEMVEAIPGFRDIAIVDGEPVYLFKKIQLLTLDLHRRFSASHPELFNFHDIHELTIFADNVIPTMLHHLNIISLSPTEDATPRQVAILRDLNVDLRTGRETSTERSFIFRAAAVDAYGIIVQQVQKMPSFPTMTTEQLDAYLWKIAKHGPNRGIIRFSDPNTVYF
jgi:hypothetical protein